MDGALVKLLILFVIIQNIGVTKSMPLNENAVEDAIARQKRSPANNFSLFGINLSSPVKTAKDSISSFGNVFFNNRANQQPRQTPAPYGIVRNDNALPPVTITNKNNFPNAAVVPQKSEKYIKPVENETQTDKTPAPDKKAISNQSGTKTELPITPKSIDKAQEHTKDNKDLEKEFEKQLLDDIFRKSPDDYDYIGTTVDNNIDFTTGTDLYETTTTDLDIRLAPAVVASLLG